MSTASSFSKFGYISSISLEEINGDVYISVKKSSGLCGYVGENGIVSSYREAIKLNIITENEIPTFSDQEFTI